MLLAAAALVCAPFVSDVVRAQTPAAEAEITIVAVDSSWPRSLDDPDLSKPLPHPLADAVEEIAATINGRGGVLGRRLVVVRDNDECSGKEAEAVAKRNVARKPHVVIGHSCSGAAIRAAALYAEAGVLLIATGPRHPRLTAGNGRPGIFRLAGRDDRQADAMAALLASAFPAARTAIVHDQSLQGRGMAEEIRRNAEAAKVAPVLVANYASGVKDHAALVGQLKGANVDLVIFPGQAFEASVIVDQAHHAGAHITTVIGADALAADVPPKRLLDATREFLVMLPWPGLPPSSPPTVDDSPVDVRLARAATEVWGQAVAQAQSVATDAVAAAMRAQSWTTVVGPITFDDKGDAAVPSFVPHVWRDGRWDVRR
jgi:branched-chain amino acid transport system substrate-binding protein